MRPVLGMGGSGQRERGIGLPHLRVLPLRSIYDPQVGSFRILAEVFFSQNRQAKQVWNSGVSQFD